jgi:hypothetical protein
MTMLNNNLKVTASALAAVFVTILLGLTFVDATSIARVHRSGDASFLVATSALIR